MQSPVSLRYCAFSDLRALKSFTPTLKLKYLVRMENTSNIKITSISITTNLSTFTISHWTSHILQLYLHFFSYWQRGVTYKWWGCFHFWSDVFLYTNFSLEINWSGITINKLSSDLDQRKTTWGIEQEMKTTYFSSPSLNKCLDTV